MTARVTLGLLLLLSVWGCPDDEEGATPEPQREPEAPRRCEPAAPAPDPLPGVREEHRAAAYWIAAAREAGLGDELAGVASLAAHGDDVARLREAAELSLAPDGRLDQTEVAAVVQARLSGVRERAQRGDLVGGDGQALDPRALEVFDLPEPFPRPVGRWTVALAHLPLSCTPAPPLFTEPIDPAFDRNLCSTAHPQEPVQVIARWAFGKLLVRTRYGLGFVDRDAALSPPLDTDDARRLLQGERVWLPRGSTLRSDDGASVTLPAGAVVTRGDVGVIFADADGLHDGRAVEDAVPVRRPLTRTDFLRTAFSFLGQPYGWGGRGGGRDCSRLVHDVFERFGLELPRNSAQQAEAGTSSIDLAADLPEPGRLQTIDDAWARGAVLLYFPGHIMIYLGRDRDGVPMALHSFAEYFEPCEGGGQTRRVVDRVAVSTLDLGAGSTRGSFLSRVTRVVVIGAPARE